MIGNRLKPIFGKGEITRFDPQIRKAFSIMDQFANLTQGGCYELIDRIQDLGFEYKHSSGDTFIGKRQVIKMALFTSEPPDIEYRIPTVIYAEKKIKYWDWDYVVAIQPKVNSFVGEYDESDYVTYFEENTCADSHSGNFGYYNRKVKLFDW